MTEFLAPVSDVFVTDGTLRETGEFEIDIQVHSDVLAKVKLTIIAEA